MAALFYTPKSPIVRGVKYDCHIMHPLKDKREGVKLGVGRVQIIRVDYSRTKNRLDIEHSRSLVSTITGTNIQYGGSRKQ